MATHIPRVSVIIPVFNAGGTLRDAIDSVRAQNIAVQIIVVDDGSDEATRDAIAAVDGIVAVRQENQGPAAARNRGLDFADAALIAFLDADDLWTAGRLRLQMDLLESRPEAGIALGHTAFSALDPVRDEWVPTAEPRLMFHLGASLVRREIFETHGRFDPALRASEDVDWFLRVRDAGIGMIVIANVVQIHRRNGLNMTRGRDHRDLQFLEVLKRSLDRRRDRRRAGETA
jgi:glycosyltransferase involved in cell wall biosynthesis